MAINVDIEKPLTADEVTELRTKLPENQVKRYIDLANDGVDPTEGKAAEEPQGDDDSKKAPAKPGPAAKGGQGKSDDLL